MRLFLLAVLLAAAAFALLARRPAIDTARIYAEKSQLLDSLKAVNSTGPESGGAPSANSPTLSEKEKLQILEKLAH
ncbi:hypothetical protein KW797_03890 [Candidatus Parcubacteria bacterium]|nr:hypothetical protein [Candidatus Parcubacteria bacterium]